MLTIALVQSGWGHLGHRTTLRLRLCSLVSAIRLCVVALKALGVVSISGLLSSPWAMKLSLPSVGWANVMLTLCEIRVWRRCVPPTGTRDRPAFGQPVWNDPTMPGTTLKAEELMNLTCSCFLVFRLTWRSLSPTLLTLVSMMWLCLNSWVLVRARATVPWLWPNSVVFSLLLSRPTRWSSGGRVTLSCLVV